MEETGKDAVHWKYCPDELNPTVEVHVEGVVPESCLFWVVRTEEKEKLASISRQLGKQMESGSG